MRIEATLRQRQEQRLMLLPQMLQAIEILQLSTLDLVAMVEHELAENETLEIAPAGDSESSPHSPESTDEEKVLRSSLDADEYYAPPRSGKAETGEEFDPLSQVADTKLSLHGQLLAQVGVLDLPDAIREIVSFVIGSLDGNGHLTFTKEELELLFPDGPVAGALEIISRLDPPGIGQNGPMESMLAQIPKADPDRSLLEAMIRNWLPDLAKNRLPKVAKALGVDLTGLGRLLGKLRHLDPCPGKSFQSSEAELLRPDVVVRREDGAWQVYVDDARVPPLRIVKDYESMLETRRSDRELKEYLRGKLGSARELIRALEQRKETLGRVARAIVDRQEAFLELGLAGLRPMGMQEIADAIAVHLSTVSRAIANKQIQTDLGIFPLRSLFDGGHGVGATEGQEGEARASAQDRVRRVFAGEDKTRPYSDDDVVGLLEAEGLHLARRTVAKYRRELGIPSSWKRKQHL